MQIYFFLQNVVRVSFQSAVSRLLIILILPLFTGYTYAESKWLNDMVVATQTLSYEGSFLYARGAEIQLMKIRHRMGATGREERIWHINGLPMEIIRKNNMLTCYHPPGGSADLEHTIPSGPYAQIFQQSWSSGLPSYQVEHLGKDRVSERNADLILLMPKQADRYSYRLWLDEETQLLLRSEIVALNMEVLEQFQFVEIEINPEFEKDDFEPKLISNNLNHIEIIPNALNKKKPVSIALSWKPSWLPEGFELSHAESMDEDQSMLNYSDGLSSFSLFFEPLSLGMPIGQQSMGATWAVTRHNYQYSMTLIGELPLDSAERVLSGIKPNSKD